MPEMQRTRIQRHPPLTELTPLRRQGAAAAQEPGREREHLEDEAGKRRRKVWPLPGRSGPVLTCVAAGGQGGATHPPACSFHCLPAAEMGDGGGGDAGSAGKAPRPWQLGSHS